MIHRISFFLIVFMVLNVGSVFSDILPLESEYPGGSDYRKDERFDYSRIDNHALSTPSSVETSIRKLTGYLIRKAGNDREKSRVIYRWITNNIEYDTYKFFSGEYKRTGNLTAEEVLQQRKAVCGGYAALYRKMAETAGLECVLISGYSKLADEELARKMGGQLVGHAWNAVKIDGNWRFIETTWGSGNLKADSQKFEKRFKEFYFLTPADIFIYSHLPKEEEWQLLYTKLSENKFKSLISPGADYFKLGYKINDLPYQSHRIKCGYYAEFKLPIKNKILMISNMKKRDRKIENRTFVQKKDGYYKITAFFPSAGKYSIGIFGKSKDQEGLYPMMLQYKVTAQKGISTDKMELICPVTPSEKFFEYGFLHESLKYRNFRIKAKNKISIVLKGVLGMQLMAELKKGKKKLESRAYVENNGGTYTVTVLPPRKGVYTLDIYGKPDGNDGLFPHLIKYRIESSSGMKLKSAENLAPIVPYLQFEELGCSIAKLSHKTKRINCAKKLRIVLESTKQLSLMATLKRGNSEIKNATFIKSSKHKHLIYTAFSREGDYELTIFGRRKGDSGQYSGLIKYNISASGFKNAKRGYPTPYSGYSDNNAMLYFPMNGFLLLNKEYKFRIKVPGAKKVAVVCGEQWTHLEAADNNIFEGNVEITSREIPVYAIFKDSGNYSGLLSYTGVNK